MLKQHQVKNQKNPKKKKIKKKIKEVMMKMFIPKMHK